MLACVVWHKPALHKKKGEYMRYPVDLKEGGCIGFPAPSFGCAIEPYYSAFRNSLEKW